MDQEPTVLQILGESYKMSETTLAKLQLIEAKLNDALQEIREQEKIFKDFLGDDDVQEGGD